jgi:hypothetical protein
MSADNYNLVKERKDGKWDVWTNLSASNVSSDDNAPSDPADRTFDTMEVAVKWAEEQGYTEYGTDVWFLNDDTTNERWDDAEIQGHPI